MDAWKLAEVKGTLHSVLLKIDILAAENEEIQPVQERLEEALEYLEGVRVNG